MTHFAKFNAWTAELADLNGDGRDDILWRRDSTGTVKVGISSASASQERVENLADKFSAWTQQLADFNGDGRTDILWHKPGAGDVQLTISDTFGNQQSIQIMAAKALGWSLVH